MQSICTLNLILKLGSSFPFNMGMLFLIWRELGMGKFPHSWLSSHSETEFLHSRLRRSWRNTPSLFLLSHSWGNGDVPFVTHGEIFFPPSWLRHSGRENPIPNSLQMRNNIPMLKEKLEPSLSIKLRVHIDCI